MKPISLRISAWGPYKKEEYVDFTKFGGRGVFLITGATGAGKTTIFDAITYCLYGNVSGENRDKDSVRSDFADKDRETFVEFVMEHNGKLFSIRRNPKYMRPKKRKSGSLEEYTQEKENALLSIDGEAVAEGAAEVTGRIREALALDYRQFKQIAMIAQGEFMRMLLASPREKTQIFRELFGTELYDRFTDILKSKAASLAGSIRECQNRMDEMIGTLSLEDEEWQVLVQGESCHYEGVQAYLVIAKQRYAGMAKEAAARIAEREAQLEKLVERILQIEHNNRILANVKMLEEERKTLLQEAETVEKRKQIWHLAKAANKAAVFEQESILSENRLTDIVRKRTLLADRIGESEKRAEGLKGYGEHQQEVEEYLKLARTFYDTWKQQMQELEKLQALCKPLEQLQGEYLHAEQQCLKEKRVYEEADLEFKRASVGIVARQLKEGQPCPVCGSIEHPSIAPVADKLPEEQDLKVMKEAYESALETQLALFEKVTVCKKEKESVEAGITLGWQALEDVEKKVCAAAVPEGVAMKGLREAIARAFRQKETADKEVLVHALKAEINREEEGCRMAVKEFAQIQSQMQEQKKQLAEYIAEEEQARGAFINADRMWEKKCKEHGFETKEAYRRAKKEETYLEREEEAFLLFETRLKTNEKLLQDGRESAEGRVYEPLEDIQREREICKIELMRNKEEESDIRVLMVEIGKTLETVKQRRKEIEKLEEEYGFVRDLSNLASGRNSKRLVFEQYVLANYFDEILRAANLRFYQMTSGRYEMFRSDIVEDARVKDNLEIKILDNYTGKFRSIKTLSGGESFKASLSIALGMSDVVQMGKGGVQIDTIFIDEGFGALDAESLDQACEALYSLVQKDKLVGIISHVTELKNRITSQIVVTKTNEGSTLFVEGN